ncbi:MAG: shikimate kinase [Alphaproteobacteria bacterium]|nr:shikimate kinase [Alphaproteobacteria bacterium]
MKKKIVLIGMMGSGKTTVGKILSKILKLNFIDTDIQIEKKCGIKIKKIFEKYGEHYFRRKEEKIILDILLNKKKTDVIALGGGAFLNKKLRKIILKETISVWLDASTDLIYKRCKKSNERPLLNEKNNNKNLRKIIKDLSKERKPIYSKAKFVVKTNEKPLKVCDKILNCIKNLV